MAKRKVGANVPCQLTMETFSYGKESLTIGKWNEFMSGPPKEIYLGLDFLERKSSDSCYFLDELGSMRFKGLDGIVYYVFIDDSDVPYHIDPSKVYRYKPGEHVAPSRLPKKYNFYVTSK